jgi:hypothetical protein
MQKNNAYYLLIIIAAACFMHCRTNESTGARIESIKFVESSKSLYVGDITTVAMSVTPLEAKNKEKVIYSVSQPGIVEIKEGSSNDGVIIEAKSKGTVVVTGKVEGFVDYCNITVGGSEIHAIPYIISPVSVLEVPVRERRSVTVSLAGGTPFDNGGFTWSYNNQKVINLESTGNVGVFETLETGSSVITVRHPKAQYPIDIIVFVLGSGESPIYITSVNNVINLNKEVTNYEFQVELIGGMIEDDGGFVYQIEKGNDLIRLNGNGKYGTITPVSAGLAMVRITHPKAKYPYDIQVIVNERLEYHYIEVNKSLILLNIGENAVIEAKFIGETQGDILEKYNYTLSENEIVAVSQAQGLFFINANKKGKTILSISNKYADFEREILIVVNNAFEGVIDNQKYIYTNQNVITMEAGGSDAVLRMILVGGNEADKNSFVWTVDDSSIIETKTEHGNVQYRSMYRSLYDNMPFEQFEAQALITPKKTGTAKITLVHPKSKNETVVIVKVYPKRTFANVPVVLGGKPYYKVEKGGNLEIELLIETGDRQNLGNIQWSVDKENVAEVEYTGLNGIIKGLSNGITALTVSGGNLKHSFSAVIIVNNESELDNQKFIYVLNPYITLTMGQSLTMNIFAENISENELRLINYINNDSTVAQTSYIKNQLIITALKNGKTEILAKGNDTNEIKITVTVEEFGVNTEQPFYLSAVHDIVGVVKNQAEDVEVSLVGGSAAKYESSIIWSVENGNIARITGGGNNVRVTGIADGQTVINVSHPKSVNALKIIVFVVANGGDLNNKVVLFAEKNNYLLERGERIYIPLLSNASDSQKAGIQWSVDNLDIINFSVSSDNMAVFITGLQTGVTRISVNHNQNIIPQVIYVSVVSRKQGIKYINTPSVIETVVGNNLTIQAITQNLESSEIENIIWSVDNASIASVAGNGANCILQAKSNGNVVVTVEQKSLGFIKNIIVYIYSSYEEMTVSYIMGVEQSYYRINKGDVIDAALTFGVKGFPEHELSNIRWSADGNNVVSVAGNGKRASIRTLNTGIAQVYAESGAAKNKKVTVEIEVVDATGVNGGYHFDIAAKDRIKGIVNGNYTDILVKLFDGTTEILSGLNKMEFEAEDPGVITLTVIDNNARVTAKKSGKSYITIKHPNVAENERILIYTADSQNELETAYPLFFEKNNYLLRKGGIVRIKAETIDDDETKLSRIRFEVEGIGVINIAQISRREITVSALEKGNDVILVKYDNEVVQRIYISVTLTVDSDLTAYLVTENIIGMVVGKTYETKVNTNLQSYMSAALHWFSDNNETVSVESFNGERAILKANRTGKTHITVKTGNIERKILVFVCTAESELQRYQAINVDQRYFVINKGQSTYLNLFSYQGKVQGTTQYSDYYYITGDFGNVIELSNKTAGSVTVNGLQEGIAGIRITNSYYNAEIVVYVEVQNNGNGGISGVSSGNYITAQQTLVVIEPNEKNVALRVEVIGGNFYQYGYFSWDGYDRTIIDVQAAGNEAVINPKKTGQTVIMVRNAYCGNELPIMVIVGNRYSVEDTNEPYLYIENTVYNISVNDPSFAVFYEVRNCPDYNYANISFSINGGSVNISAGNPGRLVVTPIFGGMTNVKIRAFNNTAIDVYFIVREKELGEIIYLTTAENYVIGSLNEVKAVDIQLVGYDEIDSNQFKWSVNKLQVAQVMGNGTRGQIYTVGEGDAVITVTHPKAKFPLQINVRVTKNAVANQLVYLTTQTNVIEGLVGEENYIYVNKIGGRENLSSCTWTVDDPAIVSISGNSYTGTFKIKKAGVASISVTNAESAFPLKIVIVAKEKTGSPLYIISSETLLSMVPGEMNKRVSVSLEGGAEKDNNGFNWSVYYQNPVDIKIAKNNGNVVTLVANANQCNITAVNEGVARIRVTHEKADNPLYITIQVSKYKQIEFPYNEKKMVTGESEFIRINLPNYENFKEKVYFVSDNPAVCTMAGTGSTALLTAHGKGYAIVKAKIEGMDQEAELYVNVVEAEDPDTNRIVTGRTSYALNPRSNSEKIKAMVYGLNINDSDNDNIWWELVNLDNSSDPVLDIYPTAAMNKERGSREIQISPRREGEAQIVIGHKYVHPKYYKTINVLVSEISNALTLDKNLVTLKEQTQTLKATIIGAKSKDYDDIVWEAEKVLMFDGTRKEVVRIMGEGQNVTLYPISDGTVEVMARYKGFRASCTVTVESQYYFSVRVQSLKMYPDEVVDINYDVRPADSIISWFSSDYGSNEPVVKYEHILSQKMVRVTGLREGSTVITGIANGKRAVINVYVRYNYSVNATAYVEFKPMVQPTDEPGKITYKVYPPNMRIEPEIPKTIVNDITLDILNPVEKGNGEPAEGIIYISAKREIPNTTIIWRLKKPNGDIIPNITAQSVIMVYYNNPKESITPYFVRNFGVWSNSKTTGGVPSSIEGPYIKNGVNYGEIISGSNNNYNINVGDGEEHYIVFDKKYENSTIRWENLNDSTVSALKQEGIEVQLVDIVHNGNMVKALRISGGTDVIEYDRVMFNKMLYVDLQSNYYIPSAGQTVIYETINEPFNMGSIKTPWQTGEQQVTENLWTSLGDYVVGYNKWYFYTTDQYNKIMREGFNSNNFTPRTNISNVHLVSLYAGYTYGSKEGKFTGSGINEEGYEVDIPVIQEGYFYPQLTVNTYPDLFSGYTPLSIPSLTTGKVFSEPVKRTYYSPVYGERELFVYSIYTANSINNFEDINDMNEDRWGNKAALLARLPSLLDEIGGDSIDIQDICFSFHTPPYSQTVVIAQPLSTGTSTWSVFNTTNGRSWSNSFSISPNIGYEGYEKRDNYNEALYFQYDGLRSSYPYYHERIEEMNITYTHRRTDITINKKAYFYSLLPEEIKDKSNTPGTWSSQDYIPGLASRWPVYNGNYNSLNIFISSTVIPPENILLSPIGYSLRGAVSLFEGKNNVWSNYYVLQTMHDEYRAGKKKDGGYDYKSTLNGEAYCRQRYRWEDSNYNIIVPIERMLQFPLYVFYQRNPPQPNIAPAYPRQYDIKYFAVPFRDMDGKNQLSGIGVTSTPMPSIDTTVTAASNTKTLQVTYRLFDDTVVTVNFTLTKYTRVCHARYEGGAGSPGSVNIISDNNKAEIQGITDWNGLKPKQASNNSIDYHKVYIAK